MTPFSVLKYIFHRFENHYIKTVFCNIWENIARVFDKNYEKKSIYLPFILLCNIDSSKERDKSKISLERIGIKNVINTTFYTYFSEKLIMIPSIKVFCAAWSVLQIWINSSCYTSFTFNELFPLFGTVKSTVWNSRL